MKICCICKKEKQNEDFFRRKDRLNGLGLQSRCKECCNIYYKNHLQRAKEYAIKWRNNNSKKINCYHVIYNGTRDNGLYSKWCGIHKRLNSKQDAYSYKDKGIKCFWNDYAEFKKDMYEKFLDHLNKYGKINTTLDRINNDGHYSKENCKWSTIREQVNNRRKYRNLGNWGKRKGRTFPKL